MHYYHLLVKEFIINFHCFILTTLILNKLSRNLLNLNTNQLSKVLKILLKNAYPNDLISLFYYENYKLFIKKKILIYTRASK